MKEKWYIEKWYKEKWYKETWIWLMLIFFILLLIAGFTIFPSIIKATFKPETLIVIGAIIIIASLCYAVLAYKNSIILKKKETTINAFILLQKEAFRTEFLNLTSEQAEMLFSQAAENPEHEKSIENILNCLNKIEIFAVGVNTGVYDIDTVNRLAGNFLINKYDILKPIISEKAQAYMEISIMANKLINYKSKQPS